MQVSFSQYAASLISYQIWTYLLCIIKLIISRFQLNWKCVNWGLIKFQAKFTIKAHQCPQTDPSHGIYCEYLVYSCCPLFKWETSAQFLVTILGESMDCGLVCANSTSIAVEHLRRNFWVMWGWVISSSGCFDRGLFVFNLFSMMKSYIVGGVTWWTLRLTWSVFFSRKSIEILLIFVLHPLWLSIFHVKSF